jgi:FtsP/CotA-like multicopper oxidase with cupredoxin domain
MSSWQQKLAVTARRNRQEIITAKLSRREMLKFGLLTASGTLALKQGLSARAFAKDGGSGGSDDISLTTVVTVPPSPTHTPWVQPLPIMPVAQPAAVRNPDGTIDLSAFGDTPPDDTTLIDGGVNVVRHQRFSEFLPKEYYLHDVREFQHRFHPDWGTSTMWGFEGRYPGPTFHAHYGKPILVRRKNSLPEDHVGFGIPEITTHLHNGHTPSESDGNPVDYVLPGQVKDHFYPNIYAGYDQYKDQHPLGDPREGMSTLWYHDHHIDFTTQNVYRGLTGMYLLFDDVDTGDETTGLRLPGGEYDIPLLLGDILFDSDYQPVFDYFNTDGILGDKQPVNGAIQPYLDVKKRRYRFRVQNTGPSRWYDIWLYDGQNFLPFWQISTDGNLLPQAMQVNHARLAVAQRVDIIVDFAKIQGKKLYLVNRAEQVNGRGPTGKLLSPGTALLQFNVIDGAVADNSRDPAAGAFPLRELPDPNFAALQALAATAKPRTFRFDRTNGAWTVNGRFFNPDVVSANPAQGTAEVWTIQNGGGGWMHPVHIHFEEHRTLTRNSAKAAGTDISRKDVIDLNPSETVKVFLRFRDFKGRYVMHCHNVVHEDHSMMIRWDIV